MSTLFLYNYLSNEPSKPALGISETWEKLGGAIEILVEVRFGGGQGEEWRPERCLLVLGEIIASFCLLLSLAKAAGSASTGRTFAWYLFCLNFGSSSLLQSDLQDALLTCVICTNYDYVNTLQWTGKREQMTQRQVISLILYLTAVTVR